QHWPNTKKDLADLQSVNTSASDRPLRVGIPSWRLAQASSPFLEYPGVPQNSPSSRALVAANLSQLFRLFREALICHIAHTFCLPPFLIQPVSARSLSRNFKHWRNRAASAATPTASVRHPGS